MTDTDLLMLAAYGRKSVADLAATLQCPADDIVFMGAHLYPHTEPDDNDDAEPVAGSWVLSFAYIFRAGSMMAAMAMNGFIRLNLAMGTDDPNEVLAMLRGSGETAAPAPEPA